MNGTSGISGISGGNCSRAEHDQYQRDFATVRGWDGTLPTEDATMNTIGQAQYDVASQISMNQPEYTYPVGSAWVAALTPGRTLAAELDVPFDRFCAVFMSAGKRLNDIEYAQMETALAELGGTIVCLRT